MLKIHNLINEILENDFNLKLKKFISTSLGVTVLTNLFESEIDFKLRAFFSNS